MSTPTKPRYGPGRPGGGAGGGPRRRYVRKKFCRFCAEKDLRIDYKNVYMLKHFVSERGKIVPRRTVEIKKARIVALIPFTATQVK
jgi:small subunit ribosomal protein S18